MLSSFIHNERSHIRWNWLNFFLFPSMSCVLFWKYAHFCVSRVIGIRLSLAIFLRQPNVYNNIIWPTREGEEKKRWLFKEIKIITLRINNLWSVGRSSSPISFHFLCWLPLFFCFSFPRLCAHTNCLCMCACVCGLQTDKLT